QGHPGGPGEGLQVLPAVEGATPDAGGLHLGRRAADDRHRPGADGAAEDDPARRAVDGPRAAAPRGDLHHRAAPEPRREGELPACRAEHAHRAPLRRLRLHPGERPRRHGRRGQGSGAERGREGVLPRLLLGRAQELQRREVLSAPQALAVKKAFFDKLETRSPKAREAALLAALPKHIAWAKKRAPGFAKILANVNPAKIRSRKALAALPLTRKSDLGSFQKALPPLGGLNATPPAKLFVSPGPINDPEGTGANWWRTARGLYAGGFREGDVILNSYAYHFTPAG